MEILLMSHIKKLRRLQEERNKMAKPTELEQKANAAWYAATSLRKLANDDSSQEDVQRHMLGAIYHQNIALGYQSEMLLRNQKEILECLKTK